MASVHGQQDGDPVRVNTHRAAAKVRAAALLTRILMFGEEKSVAKGAAVGAKILYQ